VRIERAQAGLVRDVVRAALVEARASHRRLVVYAGAPWCEPCQRFHDAAMAGALDADFADLMLLEFNVDDDRSRLASDGYRSTYIPLFALPSPDGTSSGLQIEGGVKGDGALANILPRLRDLLSR
jgi:thiol-disulfide isomerase/thioredoxin